MKKKPVIHQFDPILYPVKLFVVITMDLEHIKNHLNEYPSGKPFKTKGTNKMEAFTQMVSDKETRSIGVLIAFRTHESCTLGMIAHESTHASDQIWKHIGERSIGAEANAYLVEWIAQCIEKVKLNKV